MTKHATIHVGHVLARLRDLPEASVDCVVTSPPYWGLRAYGTERQVWGGDVACEHIWSAPETIAMTGGTESPKQASNKGSVAVSGESETCSTCHAWRGELGLEPTPELFVAHLVEIFHEVRRVLAPHGTLWMNLGDSYANAEKWGGSGDGSPRSSFRRDREVVIPGRATYPRSRRESGLKPKDMVGIPWMVAFALRADGWYLRSDIIWAKPNPMPESITDRPTKAHEYVFLFAKSERYYFDQDAVREPFESSTSDLTKMANGQDRIGGKTLDATDPLYAANASTNIGKKRGVGSAIAARAALEGRDRAPSGWGTRPGGHRDMTGRYDPSGPKDVVREQEKTKTSARFGRGAGWREPKSETTPRQDGERWNGNDGRGFVTAQIGRNIRTVWEIATEPYPEAHFATFPTELPRRCILAGAPMQVCVTCGDPSERVTERTGMVVRTSEKAQAFVEENGARGRTRIRAQTNRSGTMDAPATSTTVGWTDCGHGTWRPGVVLDPFAGSGTTLAVAVELGRDAVGVELQKKYVKLIERRIAAAEFERSRQDTEGPLRAETVSDLGPLWEGIT